MGGQRKGGISCHQLSQYEGGAEISLVVSGRVSTNGHLLGPLGLCNTHKREHTHKNTAYANMHEY